MENIILKRQSEVRKAITRKFNQAKPSAITFQRNAFNDYLKGNHSNLKESLQTMNDNQGFQEKIPDLYEEILTSQALDPYEGLLNQSKSTKKNPIDIKKKNSPPPFFDL